VVVSHTVRIYGERVTITLQIKDVREEVRDAIAARAAARGQSMQVYLWELLEREFRAERNKGLFERLAPHRTLDLDVDEVVEYIRRGREDDR
jgi:antitoxin FitA